MDKKIDINAEKKDALAELSTIGAGNATTRFSNLLGKDVINIHVPQVKIIGLDKLPHELNPFHKNVVEIHSQIIGEVNSILGLVMSWNDAKTVYRNIIRKLLADQTEEDMLQLRRDALKEMGHIVMAGYSNALSEFMGFDIDLKPPEIRFTLTEVSVKEMVHNFSKEVNYAIVSEIFFFIKANLSRGRFVLLMNEEDLSLVFEELEKKFMED